MVKSAAHPVIRRHREGPSADDLAHGAYGLRPLARALTRTPEDAEDLIQETLLRVLAQRRSIASEDPVPYLSRAIRNTCISEHRRASCRPRLEPLPPWHAALQTPDGDPELALIEQEALATVAALPEPYQATVVAVDLCGLSYRQAAVALGVPLGTIMSRLFRARRSLAPVLAIA